MYRTYARNPRDIHETRQLGGRKEHSKIARLKRHLEKMGFKGILSDSKESGSTSNRESRRGAVSVKSPRGAGGGGSTTTTPGGQLVRASSLTIASPTEQHGYGAGAGAGGLVARFSSPSSSNGRGGLGLSTSGMGLSVAGPGGNDGGRGRLGPAGASTSPLSLASLSPRRVRSSISMGGRRLSAWTLGSGAAATEAAKAADTSKAKGVELGCLPQQLTSGCCCPAGRRVLVLARVAPTNSQYGCSTI